MRLPSLRAQSAHDMASASLAHRAHYAAELACTVSGSGV